MSADRGTERIVRSWLEDGVTALPDRILDAVLDDLSATPQRRPWTARRFLMSNTAVRYAAGVAAIVALAVLGVSLLGRPGTASPPSTTPSPSPTASPSGSPGSSSSDQAIRNGQLAAGTYTYYAVDGRAANVRFTVPAGWEWVDGWYLRKGGIDAPQGAAIAFLTGDVQVYTDPCHWSGAQPSPPTRGTASSLIAALAAQPMRDATAPVNRGAANLSTPNAWSGKAVTVSVPDRVDLDLTTCDLGEFRSWGSAGNTRYHQGNGQRDMVWAVDVRDTRLVIDASSYAGTPASVQTEMQAILDSVVTGMWG